MKIDLNTVRVGVAALAALKATRFVTSDSLGKWLILDPADRVARRAEERARAQLSADRKRWARTLTSDSFRSSSPSGQYAMDAYDRIVELEQSEDPVSITARAVSGLHCPHCIGFWLGGVALVGAAVAASPATPRPIRAALTLLGSTFALSYVTGNVSARID